MEKLNYSLIIRTIRENISKSNEHLKFENSDEECPFNEGLNIEHSTNICISQVDSWKPIVLKSEFIYNTIYSKSIDYNGEKLKLFYTKRARELKVNKVEINNKFNSLINYVRYIEAELKIDTNYEFKDFLYNQAKQAYKDEQNEIEEYNNNGFLRKILDKNPPIYIHKANQWEAIRNVKKVMKSKEKLGIDIVDRKVSLENIDSSIYEIEIGKELAEARLYDISNNLTKSIGSTKNKRRANLKKCFNLYYEIKDDNKQKVNFNYKTTELCGFVITEYCRWYNGINKNEIKQCQNETANQKKREKRNVNKPNTNQAKIREERTSIIKLLLESNPNLNPTQIAQETGIPRISITRIIKNLD